MTTVKDVQDLGNKIRGDINGQWDDIKKWIEAREKDAALGQPGVRTQERRGTASTP